MDKKDNNSRIPQVLKLSPSEHFVIWAGAGISIPSGAPDAASLTWHWLKHMLPQPVYDHLRSFFADNCDKLRKSFPRLEKMIEEATVTFGEQCLELLRFLEDIPPTCNHIRIAELISQTQARAFTTNFDTAIEDACAESIPLHTPTKKADESWGLYKIHGSIHESPKTLGSTVRGLIRGLETKVRTSLLNELFRPGAVFLVVGYSGSDFFDVVPFFREFADRPVPARIVWIDHGIGDQLEEMEIKKLEYGAQAICKAFSQSVALHGPTDLGLSVLPCSANPPENAHQVSWKENWSTRFEPAEKLRWLYAARIYATLGFGRENYRCCLKAVEMGLPAKDTTLDLIANALRDMGCYQAEIEFRKKLRPVPKSQGVLWWRRKRHKAAARRLAKHSLRAWWLYGAILREIKENPGGSDMEVEQQVWSLAEAGLFYRDFLIWLAEKNGLISRLSFPAKKNLKSKIQDCVSQARNLLPKTDIDPHILATLNRLEKLLAEEKKGEIQATSLPINLGKEPWRIYFETDSVLGTVNASRDTASFFRRSTLTMPKSSTEEELNILRLLASDQASDSYKLAQIIDDHPGGIKGAKLCAECADESGRPDLADMWRNRYRNIKSRLRQRERLYLRQWKRWKGEGNALPQASIPSDPVDQNSL